MAVEIRIEYRRGFHSEMDGRDGVMVVSEEEIERGVRRVMDGGDGDDQLRKKVKEMSEKSVKALMEGGSSFDSVGRFLCDVVNNLA